jgi:hypothetical protein
VVDVQRVRVGVAALDEGGKVVALPLLLSVVGLKAYCILLCLCWCTQRLQII